MDPEKVERQLKSGYNVITVNDGLSPYTADLIVSRDPLEKKKGTIQGVRVYLQSPESLILAKLRMIKATVPSERAQKDRDDVRAILDRTKVDTKQITQKARGESTLEIFRQLSE